MEARVKSTWPFRTLQGLAGREFCKDEWRPVVPGFEEEAKRHPYLETQEVILSVSAETVTHGPVTIVVENVPGTSVEMVDKGLKKAAEAILSTIDKPKPHTTISKGKGGKK